MPAPDAPAGPVMDRLAELAARQLGVDLGAADRGALLVEDLGVDSLALTELAMTLEDEFAVELPEEQLATVQTLGDLETLVDRAAAARAGAAPGA